MWSQSLQFIFSFKTIMKCNLLITDRQISSVFSDFLNTERSYKRQGHAPLKHFVGFAVQRWKGNRDLKIHVYLKRQTAVWG